MKAFKATILTVCVLAAMTLFQGCALLLVGGGYLRRREVRW